MKLLSSYWLMTWEICSLNLSIYWLFARHIFKLFIVSRLFAVSCPRIIIKKCEQFFKTLGPKVQTEERKKLYLLLWTDDQFYPLKIRLSWVDGCIWSNISSINWQTDNSNLHCKVFIRLVLNTASLTKLTFNRHIGVGRGYWSTNLARTANL